MDQGFEFGSRPVSRSGKRPRRIDGPIEPCGHVIQHGNAFAEIPQAARAEHEGFLGKARRKAAEIPTIVDDTRMRQWWFPIGGPYVAQHRSARCHDDIGDGQCGTNPVQIG